VSIWRRAQTLQHQQEDHDRQVSRDEARHKAIVADPSSAEVQSKYMQLLKQNLRKKKNPATSEEGGGAARPPSTTADRANSFSKQKSASHVSGFTARPGGVVSLARQSSVDDSVLTEDNDFEQEKEKEEDECLKLGWQEFAEDEEEDEDDENEEIDDNMSEAGSVSVSSYNSYTRARSESSRGTSARQSPRGRGGGVSGPAGEGTVGWTRGRAVSSPDGSLRESGSESDSEDSSTDSDMSGSEKSEKSTKSGKSAGSVKSIKSIISMKSTTKDGETTILKLTPENLKGQHTEMLQLTKDNLQRPNRFNLFKELGDTVQGTANLVAGGSQNGYSIQEYMDEMRSYGRNTESEAASELGSIFSTDEMYTSPAIFLSKDHLEQERLLIKLLDSKKVRDFLASAPPLTDPKLVKVLPAWCNALWRVPDNLNAKARARAEAGGSVSSAETVKELDVESMTKQEVLAFLLGPSGLGPEPTPWTPANTSAAAAPSMKTLTRLFEGAMADYSTIQGSLKQVVQARSVLQKQLNRIRNTLKADGIAASKEMEELAIQVYKTNKVNRKAQNKWLVAVVALDDLFEIRQNISSGLVQDLEFEERAQQVVETDTQALEARKASLLESQADVAQAMAAMQADLETNENIKEALVEYEYSRRATLFLLNPSNLQYSRRMAFVKFRRRVRRQVKIKQFYSEMKEVRRVEMMYISIAKLKKYMLKQKRHRLAQAWLLRSRRERIWSLWRTQQRLSVGEAALVQRRVRRRAKSALLQWRLLSFRAVALTSAVEQQDNRVQEFKRKWIFLKWKQLARRHRMKGAVTDYTLDSRTLLQRSKTFHKRKLFVGWKRVHLQRQAQLLDREVVVMSLSYHRVADCILTRWCMAYTGCHHWRRFATSRVMNRLQHIATGQKMRRENRHIAEEFQQCRGLKVALLKLERNCRRRSAFRSKAEAVREKHEWKVLVGSYSQWRISKNEEVRMMTDLNIYDLIYVGHDVCALCET
jgi:hypothetical protein